MKKIDINNIIGSSEWGNFKELWIQSILDEFSPGVRLDWKITIQDFYSGNTRAMKELFDNLIQNNGIISVPDMLKNALEKGLPTLYTNTLGKESSGLRNPFFRLFSNIDIKICPYCNHVKLNDIQYEIDHIRDKSRNPLYSLNIYNLIPICHDCNQGKSTHHGFCNFYEDEIYNNMTFKVSGNINKLNTILDLQFSLNTIGAKAETHKNILLEPLYLVKGRGIYDELIGYIKYRKFPKLYEGLMGTDCIGNGSDYCPINECSLIHKHKHSKFILDIINDSNYDVLGDL